jgi:hypothetical protein
MTRNLSAPNKLYNLDLIAPMDGSAVPLRLSHDLAIEFHGDTRPLDSQKTQQSVEWEPGGHAARLSIHNNVDRICFCGLHRRMKAGV